MPALVQAVMKSIAAGWASIEAVTHRSAWAPWRALAPRGFFLPSIGFPESSDFSNRSLQFGHLDAWRYLLTMRNELTFGYTHTMNHLTRLATIALMAICGLQPAVGAAQAFKAPIRIVVPYAAGGGTDVLARLLGQGLSKELGQPVLIENKAGASGQIGTQFVRAAAPNGTTLLFTVDHSLIAVPLTTPSAKYDAEADFTALGQAARSVWTLSIPVNATYKDIAGLGAAVKSEPSLRSFGVPFTGGAPTLIGEALGRHWSVPMQAIPFSGSGPVIQNVMAAQVPAGITGMPEAMAVHRSGKARVIAVSGARRTALLPDVPTFTELGIAGLEFHTFLGFFAPKSLPKEMAQEFNAALRKVLADPAVLDKINGMSLEPAPTTLAEASEEVATMEHFWKKALGAAQR